MRKVHLLLIPFLLFGAACATRVDGLRVDPAFTPTIMRESTFVMAVVEGNPPLPLEMSLGFAQEMRVGFLDRRPWLRTVDAGALRLAMGEEAYEALRETFRPGGAIGGVEIDAIRAALPDVRFALFAKVERNVLRSWRDRESVRESRVLKDGTTIWVNTGYRVTANVTRRMTVSLTIIDLAANAEAWGGRVTKSRSAQRVYERRTPYGFGLWSDMMSLMWSTGSDRLYPLPDPPDEHALIRAIFAGFAENLPGEQ